MIKLPTGRGTVEEQLAEIRDYLEYQSRTRETSRQLSQADEAYQVIEQIYRAMTEARPDYNNAAVKELWQKLFSITLNR